MKKKDKPLDKKLLGLFGFVVAIIVIFCMLFFYNPSGGLNLFNIFIDIISRNIGSFESSLIFQAFILSLLPSIILVGIAVIFFERKIFWIALVIAFWLISFSVGIIFLELAFAPSKIKDWPFQDKNDSIVGKLNCYYPNDIVFIHDSVKCTFDINENRRLNNSASVVQMKVLGKVVDEYNGTETELEFNASKKIDYIYFRIYNNLTEYNVGYPYKFLTLDEYDINKREFIKYFLGLIGLIIITIPLLVKNIRDLLESR